MLKLLHLLDLQRRLQKLNNLQNSLQQLYEQTTWLIAALADATMPKLLMLASSTTSPPPQMVPQPDYPYVAAQPPVLPAPLEPSNIPSKNSQCTNPPHVPQNNTSNAGTFPVILPTMNSYKVPMLPSPAPGCLLNIRCKPHPSRKFASAFLRFAKNNYRPP